MKVTGAVTTRNVLSPQLAADLRDRIDQLEQTATPLAVFARMARGSIDPCAWRPRPVTSPRVRRPAARRRESCGGTARRRARTTGRAESSDDDGGDGEPAAGRHHDLIGDAR